MTHQQMYKKCSNAEGFVAVIVLRERYFENMKADGWFETEAEALAQPDTAPSVSITEHQAALDAATEVQRDADGLRLELSEAQKRIAALEDALNAKPTAAEESKKGGK